MRCSARRRAAAGKKFSAMTWSCAIALLLMPDRQAEDRLADAAVRARSSAPHASVADMPHAIGADAGVTDMAHGGRGAVIAGDADRGDTHRRDDRRRANHAALRHARSLAI